MRNEQMQAALELAQQDGSIVFNDDYFAAGWHAALSSHSRDTGKPAPQVAAEPASFPDGWDIDRSTSGAIIVRKAGVGGYVADENSNNIASCILYALADSLLTAATSAQQSPSDAQDTARYQYVKTMGAQELLAWRGIYGFDDRAIDAAMKGEAK